ncbi:hypothetical protein CUT44_13525 [Streptomyces carminius]|uniref:Uncharacterized protein n=1 Tax=Streptomyces carminius TaxID=2665496 RepID=A0A2M8LZ63_9ACTN|nr:hypothetical protein [Streptomyces carminius]PJE97266.1 hypothetical protein CUT44_13525 [Streptomyces carminius]
MDTMPKPSGGVRRIRGEGTAPAGSAPAPDRHRGRRGRWAPPQHGAWAMLLLRFVDHMVAEGFLRAPYRRMLLVEPDLDRLLERCADYRPPDYTWTESDV